MPSSRQRGEGIFLDNCCNLLICNRLTIAGYCMRISGKDKIHQQHERDGGYSQHNEEFAVVLAVFDGNFLLRRLMFS